MEGEAAIDDTLADERELLVVVAGVVAKLDKGVADAEAGTLHEHALRLLDQDAAVEGGAELLREQVSLLERPLLENGDSGGIREGLGEEHVHGLERADIGPEEVEGADDLLAEPDGQGVDRAVAGAQCHRAEPGPTTINVGQVLIDHRQSGTVRVQARAFLSLELEEFYDA